MALQVYLISKAAADGPGKTLVDKVVRCLFTNDDGDSDAVKIANCEAEVVAAGVPIDSGYFDTVELIGPPTAGIMTTADDLIIMRPLSDTRSIT